MMKIVLLAAQRFSPIIKVATHRRRLPLKGYCILQWWQDDTIHKSKLRAMSISNKNLKSAYTALCAASLVTTVKFRQKVIRWFPCCILPVSHDVWLLFPNTNSFHQFHLSLDTTQNYTSQIRSTPCFRKKNWTPVISSYLCFDSYELHESIKKYIEGVACCEHEINFVIH